MRLHNDWLNEAVRNTQCGEDLREEYDNSCSFDIDELACDILDEEL